ncbi:MAG: histidine phosphatase family protein [Vicinamibacterales bacterium]
MTTVLLIRHGLTDAVGRLVAGRAVAASLNAEGQAQVASLVSRLARVPLAAVVSSPLARTRETAEPIARTHDLPLELDDAFLEFDFGVWEGHAFASLDADPQWQRFNQARSLTAAPGGEWMLDVQRRAVGGLLRLRDRWAGQNVAVVSHGDVIRAAVMYALGVPLEFVHRVEIAPARITVLQLGLDTVVVRQLNGDGLPPAL